MRLTRGMSDPVFRVTALTILLSLISAVTFHSMAASAPAPAPAAAAPAELKPTTYSALFSRAKVVVSGTVTSVSTGFLSDGRKATIDVEGLYKGRLRKKEIEVTWKDEVHKETGYVDGAKVVLFLIMRKDSIYVQAAPGLSCWPVETVVFGSGRPAKAVSYEFPLDLLSGVPKGATREIEVVEKSLNFQVPKRKKWILVDALMPPLKPYKQPKPPREKKKVSRVFSPIGR